MPRVYKNLTQRVANDREQIIAALKAVVYPQKLHWQSHRREKKDNKRDPEFLHRHQNEKVFTLSRVWSKQKKMKPDDSGGPTLKLRLQSSRNSEPKIKAFNI
jgi:hypothetical protein